LQILSKISDASVFEANPDFFVEIRFLVSGVARKSDYKSGVFWQIVSLLARLCSRSSDIRICLRDRVPILPDLVDLLNVLPATSQERSAKLLDLIRFLTKGILISKIDTFLMQLLPKLLE
jgi:hypothetical protein